ncbi:MAG: fumarylacetoacetate hydrolase family protein [Deltaproteobacteria bacterium]|nr:fumarylacetoacetate hydrolase family protein [Deltaproteobacteria bacterium]
MKLVTYAQGDAIEKVGALLNDLKTLVDLSDKFSSMLDLIDGKEAALTIANKAVAENKKTISIDAVRLLAPVPRPRQMRDCMLFEKHLKQAGQQIVRSRLGILGKLLVYLGLPKIPKVWYDQPIYYKANRFSVIGTEQDVIWPSYSNMMDFECEMGIVIGKEGKDIQKENAKGHIFGYLIFNDMSARDAQFKEMAGRLGPAKGKDFDTGNILGPWLVTKDEIPDPYNLTMIARVNGEEWGRGNSGDMHHKFEELIAHVSNCETLYPGEILGSGTVGDGCGLEHGRFLKPGDVIELEVSKLGVLRNRIVKP